MSGGHPACCAAPWHAPRGDLPYRGSRTGRLPLRQGRGPGSGCTVRAGGAGLPGCRPGAGCAAAGVLPYERSDRGVRFAAQTAMTMLSGRHRRVGGARRAAWLKRPLRSVATMGA
ncbi:hypothetical protein GCM10027440_54860 [Nocardiopsis coralliicola]